MTRLGRVAIGMAVAHGIVTGAASAQNLAMDTMSLHRLPGVFVEVGGITAEALADGFNADSLYELIVAKLADARINVLTQEQWKVTLGSPVLHTRLNLLKPSPYLYIYSVEVELRQLAAMMRDSQPTFAPTWRSGASLGTVPADRIGSITNLILFGVDRFISAHAVANRTRRPFDQLAASTGAPCRGIGRSKRLKPSTEMRLYLAIQCTWGPVTRPVAPTFPSCWPRSTT
jgi:hypothetical protein